MKITVNIMCRILLTFVESHSIIYWKEIMIGRCYMEKKANTDKNSVTNTLIVILICLAGIFALVFGAGLFEKYEAEFETVQAEKVSTTEITVYITGEIANPGLYTLEKGERVEALVEKSGGVTGNADISKLNMAKVLKDGDHIKVSDKSQKSSAGTGKVNVNCKDVSQYCKISGITYETAENIVEYINENGDIKDIEELRYIPGIDEDLFDKIKNKFII